MDRYSRRTLNPKCRTAAGWLLRLAGLALIGWVPEMVEGPTFEEIGSRTDRDIRRGGNDSLKPSVTPALLSAARLSPTPPSWGLRPTTP